MVKTSMFANSTTHQPTLDPMTCSHPKVAFAQLLPLASRPPWFPLPNSVRILCKPDGCVSIIGAQNVFVLRSFRIRMCCKSIKSHLILLLFKCLVVSAPNSRTIRQQCRLTICIELDELTNSIRQQDPIIYSDTEARCLV